MKKYLFLISFVTSFTIFGIVYSLNNKDLTNKINIPIIKEEKKIIDYSNYYFDVVKTNKEKDLFKLTDDFIKIGKVEPNVILELRKDEYLNKGYFKIKDTDLYINYLDIEKSEMKEIDYFWKNYIPFNQSVRTDLITNFYYDNNLIFSLNKSLELPIIIKDKDSYGVIYKDNLFYIKKDECEVFENINTNLKHTNAFSALVYHATYDSSNQEEKRKCLNANSTICLSDTVFDSQMKYLKDNNYYSATMKDVEMFVDGKIQLPQKTVVITIDDGYYIDAAVKVLEKYNLHATLFLIGALADLDEWKTDSLYSKSLELQSHTYLMHTPAKCSGGQGSILKCGNKEEILNDLKRSREQLNGATVFCWPFFEYNDYAINLIKEAGFTMAFAGGRQKIRVGSNKYKLPRYGIINTTSLDSFISIVR